MILNKNFISLRVNNEPVKARNTARRLTKCKDFVSGYYFCI